MWLIKLPFKLLALPVLLVVCVFTIFYKLALGVSGFAAGIIYLIFGVCIVIALLQGYWMGVGIVFAAACIVFLITIDRRTCFDGTGVALGPVVRIYFFEIIKEVYWIQR